MSRPRSRAPGSKRGAAAGSRSRGSASPGDVPARSPARRERQRAEHHLQQRRLARAVRAQQRDELALAHPHRTSLQIVRSPSRTLGALSSIAGDHRRSAAQRHASQYHETESCSSFGRATPSASRSPLRATSLRRARLLSRGGSAHDRDAAHAHPRPLGDQPAQRFVGPPIQWRGAHAHHEHPVALADDLVPSRARLQADRYLQLSITGRSTLQ